MYNMLKSTTDTKSNIVLDAVRENSSGANAIIEKYRKAAEEAKRNEDDSVK